MNLILHIGTEKTGTTSIQDWLYQNQVSLLAQGICLSNMLGKTNNRVLPCYFMDYFDDWFYSKGITTSTERDNFFSGFEKKFIDEIASFKSQQCHTMIITSEHFHSRLDKSQHIKSVQNFLQSKFDQIDIICYFREQSSMRKSLYSTNLKSGGTKPIEQYRDNISESDHMFNFYRFGVLWSSHFGKTHCHFRIYNREFLVDEDISKDFIQKVNEIIYIPLNLNELNFKTVNSNLSLKPLQAKLLRTLNQKIPYWNKEKKGKNPLNTSLRKFIINSKSLNFGEIEASKDYDISKRFQSSNQKFFDEFFSGEYLFEIPKKYQSNTSENSYDVSIDILQEFFIEVIDLISDTQKLNSIADNDASILRDISLKYEKNQKLSRQDAFELMRLAHCIRPKGSFIERKMLELSRPKQESKVPHSLPHLSKFCVNVPIQNFIHTTNISLRHNFMYIVTPKVACSSIKLTLQKIELDDRNNESRNIKDIHERALSPLISPKQIYNFDAYLESFKPYTFCFVRNPFTRLLSAYLNKINRNMPQKKSILKHLGLNVDNLKQEVSFSDFIEVVCNSEIIDMDSHWRVQYYQTFQDTISYNFIGRFESFDEDFNHVLEQLDIENYQDYVQVLAPHKTNANSKVCEYYTPELADMVREKFAIDFETFGYSLELPN